MLYYLRFGESQINIIKMEQMFYRRFIIQSQIEMYGYYDVLTEIIMLIIQCGGKINSSVCTLVSNHPIYNQPRSDDRFASNVKNLVEKDGKDVNINKRNYNISLMSLVNGSSWFRLITKPDNLTKSTLKWKSVFYVTSAKLFKYQ